MVLEHFFIYFLPVITVVIAALAGSSRRLGFWLTLVLSVVITPLGGYFVAYFFGPRRRRPKRRFWRRREPDPEHAHEDR
jgi:UPF0716 family protein affecting phage T7 exclusion